MMSSLKVLLHLFNFYIHVAASLWIHYSARTFERRKKIEHIKEHLSIV